MKIKSAVFRLMLIPLILLLLPAFVEAAPKLKRVGSVTVLKGKATVTRTGIFKARNLRLGSPIFQNDRIRTERRSKVRIVFLDQSIISIGGSSALTINEYVFQPKKKVRRSALRLLFGKVKCFVNDFTGYRNRKFNVSTNTSIVGVRGTVFLVWVVNQNITQVMSFENEVEVRNRFNPSEFVVVKPNFMTQIIKDKLPTKPLLVTPEQLKSLQEGLLKQDQQKITTTTAAPSTEESTTEETTTEETTTEATTTKAPTTEATTTVPVTTIRKMTLPKVTVPLRITVPTTTTTTVFKPPWQKDQRKVLPGFPSPPKD